MAGGRPAALGYDDWIEHVFGHAVRAGRPPWYFDPGCDWWEAPAREKVAHLTRLFEDPEPALAYFGDNQIAQGLTYLVDHAAGGHLAAVCDPALPLAERLRCVRAISVLFARIFDHRCTPHLSHLDEPGAGPLNGICYMWWDVVPVGGAGTDDPGFGPMEDAVHWVMQQTLALPSIACQESALHGLGHSAARHPDAVAAIVDAYLARNPALRPELAAYARAARCGCVL